MTDRLLGGGKVERCSGKGAQGMETSVCGVFIEPHRPPWILPCIKSTILDSRIHHIGYFGFSRASNRLFWILAHLKRPVILSPVLQGEGPPYFVLPRRRDAAPRTTNPARRFRAFLRTMPGSFALKNGAQDDSTFVGWWEGGRVLSAWKLTFAGCLSNPIGHLGFWRTSNALSS